MCVAFYKNEIVVVDPPLLDDLELMFEWDVRVNQDVGAVSPELLMELRICVVIYTGYR